MRYRGSVHLGDSLFESGFQGSVATTRDQRSAALAAFEQLEILSQVYEQTHGEPLLVDPELHAWLHDPLFSCEIMKLQSPAVRLQLAVMQDLPQALLTSGAFGNASKPASAAPDALDTPNAPNAHRR